jgi:hypothetical protein
MAFFSNNQGKIAEPGVNQKESINMKNEKGHLIELKERNTLEWFSALSTPWLKRYSARKDARI